jgi:hypothetical protein
MIILDKKLIKIQENNIDVKNSLESIEKKIHPVKKLSFCEQIKAFLKEIFI